MDSYIIEMPAILAIFPGSANTTSTPIEVVGSHKVAGKGYINTENSQMAYIGAIFSSTYQTKQLYPWINSSADCMVNGLRNKPQQKQHGQLSAPIPV